MVPPPVAAKAGSAVERVRPPVNRMVGAGVRGQRDAAVVAERVGDGAGEALGAAGGAGDLDQELGTRASTELEIVPA